MPQLRGITHGSIEMLRRHAIRTSSMPLPVAALTQGALDRRLLASPLSGVQSHSGGRRFIVSLVDLKLTVAQSEAWRSSILAKVAGANIKVMRMDGAPYPDESHDYPEGLLVVDGQLNLVVGSDAITVRAGEIFIVPVGVAHAVAPGSTGTLVIFDA
jgi:quercetin dioxygenase-like cupin family protein